MEPKKEITRGQKFAGIIFLAGAVILIFAFVLIISLGGPKNTVFTGNTIPIDPQPGTYHISGVGIINYKMVSTDVFTFEKDDFMDVVTGQRGNAPLGWDHYTSSWWQDYPIYSEASGKLSPGSWNFTKGSAVMYLSSDQPISVVITASQWTSTDAQIGFIMSIIMALILVSFGMLLLTKPIKQNEEQPKEPEEQKK